MGKVIIKALAGEAYVGDKYLEDKSTLDGIDCQDEFVEYMFEDFKHKLGSGYMDFRFEDGKLWTYTVYSTTEDLTDEELKELGEYTQDGDKKIYDKNKPLDKDSRFGASAYGFSKSQLRDSAIEKVLQ